MHLKLFTFHDAKIKLSFLPWVKSVNSVNGLYQDLAKKETSLHLQSQGIRIQGYKKTKVNKTKVEQTE